MSEELVPAGSLIDAALSPFTRMDDYDASVLLPELAELKVSVGTPANTDESGDVGRTASLDPELSQLADVVENLGGLDGLKQLAAVASTQDPVALTANLLNTDQQAALLYSAVDNPVVQEQLLNDIAVQTAIANKFFRGIPLLEVAEAVEQSYEKDPSFEARQQATAQSLEASRQAVQLAVFEQSGKEVARSFGLDLNDPKNARQIDAWLKESVVFGHQYREAIQQAVTLRAAGNNFQATVLTAKLSNAYKAYMIKLCNQLSPQKAVKKAASAPAAKPKEFDALSMTEEDIGKRVAREIREELAARQ